MIMKRIIVLFVLICTAVVSKAQTDTKLAQVTRVGNRYYYQGWGMRGFEYSKFLADNCTAAYNEYLSGYRTSIAGWCFFTIGAVDGIAWAMTKTISNADKQYGNSSLNRNVSIVTGVASIIFLVTGGIALGAGYHRMHNSANIFNNHCSGRNPERYWSMMLYEDRISIALNF